MRAVRTLQLGWIPLVLVAGGVSYNELTPNQSEDLDPVSGEAWLNGFPARVEALGTDTRKTDPSTPETIRRIRSWTLHGTASSSVAEPRA